VKYFPCFEDVRPMNMWAGQYAVNGFDELPVVAPAPGMIYVGAASGSGIMKCDSIARIVAALYGGRRSFMVGVVSGWRILASTAGTLRGRV